MRCNFVKTCLNWIIISCSALSLSYAQMPNYTINPFSGTSIGFNLSYNHSHVNRHFYRCDWQIYSNFWKGKDVNVFIKQKRCNFDPSITLGYSFFRNNWYFGAVGEFSFSKSRKKSVPFGPYFNAKFTTSGFSWGIKAMSGYYFKDLNTLIYGIAGLKWRNIETQIDYSDRGSCFFNSNYDDGGVFFSGPKEKLSNPLFVLGVGIERSVYEKLSVFAEYEYTWRNSKDTVVPKRIGTYKFRMKEHLKEHSFRLGVKYHI